MKTAEYYLIIALEESGITTTDDIDSKILNAMEEYANQFKSSHASTEMKSTGEFIAVAEKKLGLKYPHIAVIEEAKRMYNDQL